MQRVPLFLMLLWLVLLSACSSVPVHKGPDEMTLEHIPIEEPRVSLAKHLPTVPKSVQIKAANQMSIENDKAKPKVNAAGKKIVPHIALLLPLKSSAFKNSAEAVRQGFMAAADSEMMRNKAALPIRLYSSVDETNDVATIYRQAVDEGARAVVGPLTRNGVVALVDKSPVSVPTLALNAVDVPSPATLYFFGLAVEFEARQVATQMHQDEIQRVILVTSKNAVAKRVQAAFLDEWNRLGKARVREIEFDQDVAVFQNLLDSANSAVFLALDADKARLIRTALSPKLPVYATSLVFLGNQNTGLNYELNRIRFWDMPWLLQADHPAVMVYPRANPALPVDRERLYALGIDAYRLIQVMLSNKYDQVLPLDGVTGSIVLSGRNFQRVGIPAMFENGKVKLLNQQ